MDRETNRDYIIAGDEFHSVFTDLIPDTTISLERGLGELVYKLDMDMNETYDYYVRVYSYEYHGLKPEIVSIYPYDGNLIGSFDSTPRVEGLDTISFKYIYSGVDSGDTIDESLTFKNKKADIAFHDNSVSWQSWDEKPYVPVCLISNENNRNYGWVKISKVSSCEITIESYAIAKDY